MFLIDAHNGCKYIATIIFQLTSCWILKLVCHTGWRYSTLDRPVQCFESQCIEQQLLRFLVLIEHWIDLLFLNSELIDNWIDLMKIYLKLIDNWIVSIKYQLELIDNWIVLDFYTGFCSLHLELRKHWSAY